MNIDNKIRFTRFKAPIAHLALPLKFTFPFYYDPHPLAVLAAEQLQEYLTAQPLNWKTIPNY